MKRVKPNDLDPMKKWIKEAGTDSPGSEFHLSVLKKIETLPQISTNYEPVISSLGWKLILVFISVIVGGSFVFVPADQNNPSLFDKFPPLKLPSFKFDLYSLRLPMIEISTPFLMGIVTFFILGFIMIVGTIRKKHAGI